MGNPIGFSTGAVARGDFRKALAILADLPVEAIELSALRMHELGLLLGSIPRLDLARYRYVSFHAPSNFMTEEEDWLAQTLEPLATMWPVVLHPDQIRQTAVWSHFRGMLAIENMDPRKSTGRTVDELKVLFRALPRALFCFDVGHALACGLSLEPFLDAFGPRLAQIHLSQVSRAGQHESITPTVIHQVSQIIHRIPVDLPVIIESVVDPGELENELARAHKGFARITIPPLGPL